MSGRPTVWTDARVAQVREVLAASGGDVAATAKRIGVSPSILRSLLRDKGIAVERKVAPLSILPDPQSPSPGPVPAWQDYSPRASWIPPQPTAKAKAAPEKTRVTVMLSDVHVPYQHRRNVACALSIIREIKPDAVDLMGDIAEVESLSRHPKSRPDLARVAEEHYATNLFLDDVQNASGGCDTRYLEGNHEARARRFEAEYGQLDGVLSIPQALYIEPRGDYHREAAKLRGIKWVPLSMQPLVVGNCALLHGVFEAQHHAFMNAQHLGPRHGARYLFSGHMHGWQSSTSASGFTAFSLPWLGDGARHVFQAYVKGKPRPWNDGLVIRDESGSLVTVTPVFIDDGRALFGGRIYQSRGR